jgi:hypothetical protein
MLNALAMATKTFLNLCDDKGHRKTCPSLTSFHDNQSKPIEIIGRPTLLPPLFNPTSSNTAEIKMVVSLIIEMTKTSD